MFISKSLRTIQPVFTTENMIPRPPHNVRGEFHSQRNIELNNEHSPPPTIAKSFNTVYNESLTSNFRIQSNRDIKRIIDDPANPKSLKKMNSIDGLLAMNQAANNDKSMSRQVLSKSPSINVEEAESIVQLYDQLDANRQSP